MLIGHQSPTKGTNMPTTKSKSLRQLSFTSDDPASLKYVIALFFASTSLLEAVSWIDERGFHLAAMDHRELLISAEIQFIEHGSTPEALAESVIVWLDGLSDDERRRICDFMPTEAAYSHNPRLSLRGYKVFATTSPSGWHQKLTVIPHWA